jgi:hypothetical protein
MAGSDGGASNLVQDFEESFQVVGGCLVCPPLELERRGAKPGANSFAQN